jgi:type VI secretion system secreted protein VgrG
MNQETRFLRWLGDCAQQWILLSLKGEEKLSQPYCWEATFRVAEGAELPQAGKKIACEIGIGERKRIVQGVLTWVEQSNARDGVQTFSGRIEPDLVLTKAVRKMRVFQHLSVPDLVVSLLKEHEINDVKLSLSGDYPEKEYLVQYCESDFSFINRLLEAAGITYFFVHHADKNELILADHANAWPGASLKTLPYLPVSGRQQNQGVASWSARDSMLPGGERNAHQMDDIYPEAVAAKICEPVTAVSFSRAQLQCEGMSCGESFTLEKHPSADAQYAIYALSFQAVNNLDGVADYQCHAEVFPVSQPYKPALTTSIPHLGGVFTATVVGPDSEEIHTDELGRIKIQFPWDEKHPHDDSSSCWMRVSQPWSAGNFGALFLPRVGTEVLVSFVQGHPDHPIITGTVYSERQKPPVTLPDEKNLSGLISRSSLDGDINEGHRLLFDDKKQQEKLIITSQKDLLLTVKNDADITIAANRTSEITEGNDQLTLKKGDRIITLKGGDHKTTIAGGGSQLKADKACVIESTEAITLKVGGSEITLKPDGITLKSAKIMLKADTDVAVESAKVGIKGSASVAVEGAKVDVKGSAMVTVDGGLIKLG